jgi:hypothetical protein
MRLLLDSARAFVTCLLEYIRTNHRDFEYNIYIMILDTSSPLQNNFAKTGSMLDCYSFNKCA